MEKPILLIPGASATGRDYLLDKILEEQALREVCRRLGRDNLNVKIVVKTTDRPGRPGVVEVTKKCISPEEFDQGLASGDIFAHYVLESNGSRYGYTANAFDVADADLLVADASIYQVAQLKSGLVAEFMRRRLLLIALFASTIYCCEARRIRKKWRSGLMLAISMLPWQ
ncbi:MAG TPA: hypothetical protein PK412_00085 [bacterium]|nr:hypothetical protein [bacterium]